MSKGKNIFYAMIIGIIGMFMFGCGYDNDVISEKVEVKLSALFAKMQSATIFNQDGSIVQELSNGRRVVHLVPGTYYVNIRDNFGKSAYDDSGRLMFGARAEGAKLVLRPHRVSGISTPLAILHVGDKQKDGIGSKVQALYEGAPTGDRGLLLWQATRSMIPEDDVDDEDWDPKVEMFATTAYISEDSGAWNSLRTAYGTNVSCRNDNDTSNNYLPCSLTEGADELSNYACQMGSCTNNYHGGQCKAFSNLIAYRSSVFHGPSWAWKSLPLDTWIDSNCNKTTSGSIQAGDVLRSEKVGEYEIRHSVIVARVFSSTSIMVIDSNWVRPGTTDPGDGYELIGAHEMSFSDSGINDLDKYYVLGCVYNNDCSSSCN